VNVVDSSAWLEYFADGPNATAFAPPIQATAELVVPSITLLEVFKRVYLQRGEGPALQAVALMQQGQVVDLDAPLALAAAKLSADSKLPLADSVMLATARRFEATLWTQDADFEGLEGVRYRAKPRTA
jgi:predicted nucleic acid-binding protein